MALTGGAVALFALGLLTGYREFVVLGAAAVVVALIAALLPRLTSPIALRRIDPPRLVARGSSIDLRLAVSSERLVPPTRIIDQLSGLTVPIELPTTDPAEPTLIGYRLQALRRGVHQLGPVLEERTDPLSLVVRTVRHDCTAELLVHPTVHELVLTESGSRVRQARAVVPRFSEDPLADFRSLREYVVGDDQRLVHWPSTAKTGNLMVRDHFELRRTTRTVILETLDRCYSEVGFEDAVEIAASLVCESLEHQISVVARTRDRASPGHVAPMRHRHDALELFTRVQRTREPDTLPASALRLGGDPADQVFLVTGDSSPLATQLARTATVGHRLIVVRVVSGARADERLAARCVDVVSAEQFAARWSRGLVPR